MTALVIDLSRAELAVEELQDAADAIALASTSRLNGEQAGWISSKRAAFSVLERSNLYGDDGQAQTGGFGNAQNVNETDIDPTETDLPYSFIEYDFNNLVMLIERGTYVDAGGGNYVFSSYETLLETDMVPDDPTKNKFEAALATKVTLRLKTLDTTFARLLPVSGILFKGRKQFNDLEATSISALESFRN